MPSALCCVTIYYTCGGHQFPHGDPKRYSAWVNAIRRDWPKGKGPIKINAVCYDYEHFVVTDYLTETRHGQCHSNTV